MEGSLVAYKVFTNGSVLQASEVNDNLMKQAVATFSNAAARTAAITSPVEGQMTYLEDTNQVSIYSGSSWQVIATSATNSYNLVQTLYYTSSGTFTKATYPWLRAVKVRLQGAGGGSGGCSSTGGGQISAGAGGAGGGYAEKFITNITGLSASETITVGAGGAGGAAGNNNGSAGGNTVAFGVTANGGSAGPGSIASSVGSFFLSTSNGSGSSGGDISISGSDSISAVGLNADRVIPAVGGSSHLSGLTSGTLADSGGRQGFIGKAYGGGASGPAVAQSGSQRAGQAGGAGIVIVELYA
jgi:hypothetical protein